MLKTGWNSVFFVCFISLFRVFCLCVAADARDGKSGAEEAKSNLPAFLNMSDEDLALPWAEWHGMDIACELFNFSSMISFALKTC